MRHGNQQADQGLRDHGRWDGPPERFGFGGGRRGRRGGPGSRARRGDVRAAALALLTERPMHGYEMIQELEERTDGVWRPSPGAVYPALQLLEDQGFVDRRRRSGQAAVLADRHRSRGGGQARATASRGTTSPRASTRQQFKLRDALGPIAVAARQVAIAGTPAQQAAAADHPRRHRGRSSTRSWPSRPPTPTPTATELIGHDLLDPPEQVVEIRPPRSRAQARERARGGVGIGHRHDTRGRCAVQHAEVPVAARRTPRLGVEHEVVVGQLDRAHPPARQRLRHRDLELTDRTLLVEVPHPRVGHRGERIGVVHQVRACARASPPTTSSPRGRARGSSCVDRHRHDVDRLAEPTHAVGRVVADHRDDGRPGALRGRSHAVPSPQNSRRSSGAPARSSSRSISTHSTPRLCANTFACGLMRVATNMPTVGARLGSRSSRSW